MRILNELKDRDRGMILLLLDKIEESGEKRFIPLLMAWREIEYKKLKEVISSVIGHLERCSLPDNVIELRGYRQTMQCKE